MADLVIYNADMNDMKLDGSAFSGEGTQIKSTTNSNEADTKFLRADGDGSCSWQIPADTNTTYSAGTGIALSGTTFSCDLEGTELASTGEGNGTKFLREDGDGSCSWQTPGYIPVRTVGVDLTGNGSTDNTLQSSEDLVLKAGTNVTLAEASGIVTINAALDASDDLLVQRASLDNAGGAGMIASAKTGTDGIAFHIDSHVSQIDANTSAAQMLAVAKIEQVQIQGLFPVRNSAPRST